MSKKQEPVEKKLSAIVEQGIKEAPFNFEVDKRIDGALFLRRDGKAEFYPKKSREGKGGMTTTNKTDGFTIQESQSKVKVTLSFEKNNINFDKVLKQVGKLVNSLQSMKII